MSANTTYSDIEREPWLYEIKHWLEDADIILRNRYVKAVLRCSLMDVKRWTHLEQQVRLTYLYTALCCSENEQCVRLRTRVNALILERDISEDLVEALRNEGFRLKRVLPPNQWRTKPNRMNIAESTIRLMELACDRADRAHLN